MSETIRTYREEAIYCHCPRCGAQPRRSCIGPDGWERAALHDERHRMAVHLGAPRVRDWRERDLLGPASFDLLARPGTRPEDGRPDGRRRDERRRTAARP